MKVKISWEQSFLRKFLHTVLKILSAQISWNDIFFQKIFFSRTCSFLHLKHVLKICWEKFFKKWWFFSIKLVIRTLEVTLKQRPTGSFFWLIRIILGYCQFLIYVTFSMRIMVLVKLLFHRNSWKTEYSNLQFFLDDFKTVTIVLHYTTLGLLTLFKSWKSTTLKIFDFLQHCSEQSFKSLYAF